MKGVWRRLQRHSSQLCRSSRRAREGLTKTVRVSCTANPLSVLFLILQLDTFIPIPAPSPLPSTRSRLVSLLFVEHFLLIYAEQRTIVSPCFAAAGGVEVGRDCCAECDEEGRELEDGEDDIESDEMECRRRDGCAWEESVEHQRELRVSERERPRLDTHLGPQSPASLPSAHIPASPSSPDSPTAHVQPPQLPPALPTTQRRSANSAPGVRGAGW